MKLRHVLAAITLISAALIPVCSWALFEFNPDSMGIYFDQQANTNEMHPAPFTPFNMYFMLTLPTGPVYGVEFQYRTYPNGASMMRLSRNTALPELVSGGDTDLGSGWYRLAGATPMPPSTAMVLVTWNCMLTNNTYDLWFYLRGLAQPSLPGNLPVIDGGAAGLRYAGVFVGGPDLPVATTGHYPVLEETSSFGSVKSLFR